MLIITHDFPNVKDYLLTIEHKWCIIEREVIPMSIFSEQLRRYRAEAGLSQSELAATIGISKSSINMYERGEREPSFATLSALCGVFGVEPSVLLNGGGQPVAVPMLGEIACGRPIFANEDREPCIPPAGLHADFALRAHGDSMIGARITDGDLIFIRRQSTVENGEIAAVAIGDTATLKRVYYYPEEQKLSLNAENPRYAPLIYVGEELEQVKILGKAVAFQSIL